MSRVLIVEDNPLGRELIVAVLETLECEIVATASAEEALAVAATSPPDLVLLDLRLPGMSGMEALAGFRCLPGLHGLPVIAVTAQAMHGDDAIVREAGFDAYLSKPIDTGRLRDLVRQYLGPRRSP